MVGATVVGGSLGDDCRGVHEAELSYATRRLKHHSETFVALLQPSQSTFHTPLPVVTSNPAISTDYWLETSETSQVPG